MTSKEVLIPGPLRVRVSGPQVGANKGDHGDRPCMWVFWDGREYLAHDVVFHGPTHLRQDFTPDGGCPVTGAVLWLESDHPATVSWREDDRLSEHIEELGRGTLQM